VLTVGLWGVTSRGTEAEARFALRWLLLTVAWATIALAILAPSLQTVVAGLPNDHYHAFIDPIVVTIVGVAGALLATRSSPSASASNRRTSAPILRGAVAVIVVALVAIAVWRWPSWTDPNGGWPAADTAGHRIVAITGDQPVAVLGVPDFKSPDAITFPIVNAGGHLGVGGAGPAGFVVVVCDRLFESVVGDACGGPAEDLRVGDALEGGSLAFAPTLVDRFDVSARTSVSVYKP
jgi:hypothetical protein